MHHLDPYKVYLIQVHAPGINPQNQEVCIGSKVDVTIQDIRNKYPDFKRIIVYDADTKDAVSIIKQ